MADGETPPVDDGNARALKLLDALWNDTTGEGAKVRAKAKELFPDLRLPEDNMAPALEPMKAELAKMQADLQAERDDRAAEKKAAEESATRLNLEKSLDDARAKFRLTDEGFDLMVQRIKDKGNYTDIEAAAAWVAQQMPPPAAPGPSWKPSRLTAFDPSDVDDLKRLHASPTDFMDDEMAKFAADPDGFTRQWGNA